MIRFLRNLLIALAIVVPVVVLIWAIPALHSGVAYNISNKLFLVYFAAFFLCKLTRDGCLSALQKFAPGATKAKAALTVGEYTLWLLTVNVVILVVGALFPQLVYAPAPLVQILDALLLGLSLDAGIYIIRKGEQNKSA